MSPLLRLPALALASIPALLLLTGAAAATPPPIRVSVTNQVPDCVTPERMMSFIISENPRLDPRYKDIAEWYKSHGETWRVRWDYAMYQMIIETNFLSYLRGNGRPGDVAPHQNNFAGIGATGGGVPGDRFPDIKTGVLAQVQHLVVYSGERVAEPAAPRTQLKQDDILKASARLDRDVTFGDLASRWAADKHYGRSIEAIAARYRSAYCDNRAEAPNNHRAFLPPPFRLGGPMPEDLGVAPRKTATAFRRPLTQLAQATVSDAPLTSETEVTSPVRTIWSRHPAENACQQGGKHYSCHACSGRAAGSN